jgi:hypothetical protein
MPLKDMILIKDLNSLVLQRQLLLEKLRNILGIKGGLLEFLGEYKNYLRRLIILRYI